MIKSGFANVTVRASKISIQSRVLQISMLGFPWRRVQFQQNLCQCFQRKELQSKIQQIYCNSFAFLLSLIRHLKARKLIESLTSNFLNLLNTGNSPSVLFLKGQQNNFNVHVSVYKKEEKIQPPQGLQLFWVSTYTWEQQKLYPQFIGLSTLSLLSRQREEE